MTRIAIASAILSGALLALPTNVSSAEAAPAPHFIVHAKRETSGPDKGWMRYDVQSSEHWAYDRVWLQCIAPGYEDVGFVTINKKRANKHGHAVFHAIAKPGHTRMRCRFFSPPAPGYPAEKSRVFRLKYKI